MKPIRRGGFSLLEVMLGALIVATVIGGLSGVWMLHQRILRDSRNRLMATFILQSEMERCLAQGFHSIPAVADEEPEVIETERTFAGNSNITSFTSDVSFQENPSGTMRQVWVTVTYEDPRKGPQSLELETLVFKNE